MPALTRRHLLAGAAATAACAAMPAAVIVEADHDFLYITKGVDDQAQGFDPAAFARATRPSAIIKFTLRDPESA
ncbi:MULTISPECIES: twin-arginine translocation signal domain-containing protein [unclassified Bradyrhizobium]|uniref:twin-arginine translocation signal domain-containing protein n=1 Tax=unclassified Bradyrhizobium TaxID=2631580 RepID=UPI002FF105FB